MQQPEVFQYTSFREFLRDWFSVNRSNLTQRAFAKTVGCSYGQVSNIISGRRKMDVRLVEPFCRELGLKGEEANFFWLLVRLEQSVAEVERNRIKEQIAANRRFRMAQRISGELFALLMNWYTPVILELMRCEGFSSDPRWISKNLAPRITVGEVRKAIAHMKKLGLIHEKEDGTLERSAGMLVTDLRSREELPPQTESEQQRSLGGTKLVREVVLYNHHRSALELAQSAMRRGLPAESREYLGFNVAVSGEALPLIKREIQNFQKHLLGLCNQPEFQPLDQVFQLNIQFFPVTEQTG